MFITKKKRPSYRYPIERLIMSLIDKLWTADFLQKYKTGYVEFNRSLADAIQENVEVICVNQVISRRAIMTDAETDYLVNHAKHKMAAMLAEEILKSNKIEVQETQNYMGDIELICTIPIIAVKNKE